MLLNLEHGNRSNFDQKILMGLFEEYTSDSDEGDKANRVMDTEEERKEFYSISLPPPSRTKQFNKNKTKSGKYDLKSLKNLYKNESMVYIGQKAPQLPQKKSFTEIKKNLKSYKTTNNSILSDITEGSSKRKKKLHHKLSNNISQMNKSTFKRVYEGEEVNKEESSETEERDNVSEKPNPYYCKSFEERMMLVNAVERRQIEAEEEKEKERKKELKKLKRERNKI